MFFTEILQSHNVPKLSAEYSSTLSRHRVFAPVRNNLSVNSSYGEVASGSEQLPVITIRIGIGLIRFIPFIIYQASYQFSPGFSPPACHSLDINCIHFVTIARRQMR